MVKRKEPLKSWVKGVQEIIKSLVNPIDNYDTKKMTEVTFKQNLKIPEGQAILARVLKSAESKFPKATPEMDAWDVLTRIETRLGSLEKTKTLLLQKVLVYKRSTELSENFL